MTSIKILVTILSCLTLSFTAMAYDEEKQPSPEEQCSENDSYEDISGNWQSCEYLAGSELASDDSNEWPEAEDKSGEYESEAKDEFEEYGSEVENESGEYEQETVSE